MLLFLNFLKKVNSSLKAVARLRKHGGPQINLYVIQEAYIQLLKYWRLSIHIVLHINTTAASMCMCVYIHICEPSIYWISKLQKLIKIIDNKKIINIFTEKMLGEAILKWKSGSYFLWEKYLAPFAKCE